MSKIPKQHPTIYREMICIDHSFLISLLISSLSPSCPDEKVVEVGVVERVRGWFSRGQDETAQKPHRAGWMWESSRHTNLKFGSSLALRYYRDPRAALSIAETTKAANRRVFPRDSYQFGAGEALGNRHAKFGQRVVGECVGPGGGGVGRLGPDPAGFQGVFLHGVE